MTANTTIEKEIYSSIHSLLDDKTIVVDSNTALIGDSSVLDSMNLVQLCLFLEDKSSEYGFEFDWTSETAMSKSRSMFRTAGALVSEFITQMESNQ